MPSEEIGMESRSADAEIALHDTEAIVARSKALEGPLLPILHDVQRNLRYVPQAALPVIAEGL
jgi:formate dehydrogenase subunit gamma